MLHRLRLIPLLLLMAFSAHAEPSAAKSDSPAGSAAPGQTGAAAVVNSALDAELFYELLLGELSTQSGDVGMGYSLLLDAARKTHDPRLYQRSVEIALQARAGESALQAAEAWKKDLPESREANRFVLQILIALNRMGEVTDPLRREVALANPLERDQVIIGLPSYFARSADKAKAAELFEKAVVDLLDAHDTASAAWTAVGRMRLAAGDRGGALDAARKATAANPQAPGPAMLALALLGPGQAEPEKMVQAYLAGHPRVDFRLAYVRTLLDMQRYSEAEQQITVVTREQPGYAEGWLIQGSLQLEIGQSDAAEKSLLKFLDLARTKAEAESQSLSLAQGEGESDRALDQAYLALAQIAEQRKDYVQAESWLDKIEDPDDLSRAQLRRAGILARQGRIDDARELIHQLPERSPAEARIKVSAEVQLLRDNRQYQAAYDLLADANQRNPHDADLLYDQATLAEKLGRLDEMEQILRGIIADKPDYHHAYNALGYSLADRNVRLDEARQLILKALEYAPGDPYVTDSLGWVEFRAGRKSEALKVLQQAFQARPDPEIAAHLGEVLWSMGQQNQALAIWREGLKLSPDNETLQETLQRLHARP